MAMTQRESVSWFHIILIYLIGIFGMMVVSGAVPALGGIAAEFRPPSPSTIGWVMSMPALAAAVSSLLIGWLVDRLGERPVMIAGSALVVLGDIGVIVAHNMDVLLAWRIVGGLGYVGMVVAAVTMITHMTSGHARTAALALWSTVIPASFIVASLYGAIAGETISWRFAFIAHACGTAALILAAALILPHPALAGKGASRLKGIGAVFRTPWPFVLGASFAAAAFLQTGFIATLPRMLSVSIGAEETTVHSFNAAAMICNVIGAFSFGLFYNRGIKSWHLGLGAVALCAVSGVGLVLAPTALGPAIVMNCLLMLGLGLLVGMWALLPVVAPSPECIGATSGLITQITLLGVLFGPPMAFAAGAAGAHGSLIFLAFGIAICTIAWPIWRRPVPSTAAAAGH